MSSERERLGLHCPYIEERGAHLHAVWPIEQAARRSVVASVALTPLVKTRRRTDADGAAAALAPSHSNPPT